MKISFCLPQQNDLTAAAKKAWEKGELVVFDDIQGKATHQSWIYQTWQFLKKSGVECNFSTELETEGVVIMIGGSLDSCRRPPKEVFFVDIVADGIPHPAADLHIVQNKAHASFLPNAIFMPHWPQPYLIKRDVTRGNRFQNVAFFGNPSNLTKEMHSEGWINLLRDHMGLTFTIHRADRWHDYRDVDCAIAIRDFSEANHLHKPAVKLYNAWHAGVPFIGGRDSAYNFDGIPWENYLKVDSLHEVVAHLKRLQEYPDLRMKLVAAGDKAAVAFTQSATLKRWREFIEITLPPLARKKLTA